jgi:hypothetical protein
MPGHPKPAGGDARRLDAVIEELRRLFAAEHARGEQAAIARVLAAAQGTMAAPKRNGAPTTRNLIDAELKRAGSLTAREIFESDANSGGAVSRDGIEQCLKRGKKAGRYAMQDGKWSLAT